MAADCCVFKFLRRSVDGKHLMRFQSENAVVKFLRPSVDGAFGFAVFLLKVSTPANKGHFEK